MDNLNAPLVVRLSRTPKSNLKKNFCSKSFYSVKGWNTTSFAPIVDKDLGKKFILGLVWAHFDYPF